jgi:hypothetical protein
MLRGTISTLPVRYPTDEEFTDKELERFELTYETPEWDHTDSRRPDNEDEVARLKELQEQLDDNLFPRSRVELLERQRKSNKPKKVGQLTVARSYDHDSRERAIIASISNTLLPDTLAKAMREHCHVSSIYARAEKTSNGLTAEQLARNWRIPIAKARQTLEVTTQRGIRTGPELPDHWTHM